MPKERYGIIKQGKERQEKRQEERQEKRKREVFHEKVVQRNQNRFSNGHPIHGEKNPCESIIEFNDLQVDQRKRQDLHREGHPQHHHERQVKQSNEKQSHS